MSDPIRIGPGAIAYPETKAERFERIRVAAEEARQQFTLSVGQREALRRITDRASKGGAMIRLASPYRPAGFCRRCGTMVWRPRLFWHHLRKGRWHSARPMNTTNAITYFHQGEPMTTYYKVLGKDRMPIHGGSGQWPEPGKWTATIKAPKACERGWHIARIDQLADWLTPDCEVWEVEAGKTVDAGDKCVATRARLIRKAAWGDGSLKAYEEATAPALKAYAEADAAALKAYAEAKAAAWKVYDEADAAWKDAARKAYEEATAAAWKAYKEATAAALLAILEGREEDN